MTIETLQPELLFLKLLLNKEAYDKYNGYIDRQYIKDNFRELSFLYGTLDALHKEHTEDIGLAALSAAFAARYPDSDRSLYGGLFESLNEAEISPEIGESILRRIKERRDSLALSETAFRVAQGLQPRDELDKLIKEFGEAPVSPVGIRRVNIYESLDNIQKGSGRRWRLDCLNKSLGSLRDGDFGFVFARPETGKTTFLASEVTAMLANTPRPIVWFNNEEDGDKVGVRIIQAYFGITLETYTAKKRYYLDRFREDVGDKLHLYDEGILNKKDIEATLASVKPSVVIYDQIDKIRGFQNDRDDLRLGSIYQWARELAKTSHAAIGVCQADGSAEGVRYLTMEHVANAKTSKQAEADFIIGIGCQHGDGQDYIRYLNISKNKLFGDEDSIPDLRHGRFEVLIEPAIARYKDIIKFD